MFQRNSIRADALATFQPTLELSDTYRGRVGVARCRLMILQYDKSLQYNILPASRLHRLTVLHFLFSFHRFCRLIF